MKKARVFVITPFNEDFLALYEELKKKFEENFEFTNAGDLDNQQNIIQDIIEGIYQADVIIADLTGLNANVFYELGLAHAMNKKVIIITQDLSELPFDIKSYRANEYSLQFNKLPKLIEELKKLLAGAVDGSVRYGNPVSDYVPDYFEKKNVMEDGTQGNKNEVKDEESAEMLGDDEDKGFLDYIADVEENSVRMTAEITAISNEMNEMNVSVNAATNEINRVKANGKNVEASFVRNTCRKLAEPVEAFAGKLKGHIYEVSKYWNIVENSYLALLDNSYAQQKENTGKLKETMTALEGMQDSMSNSDVKIEGLIAVLRGNMGMERRLNRALSSLICELESYLQMTETMHSSVDRILGKGEVVISMLEKE